MTRLRAEDLPLAVRRQIAQHLGTTSKPRPSRAGTGAGAPCPGSCACGEHFDRYTTFERTHARPGHRRWLIDL